MYKIILSLVLIIGITGCEDNSILPNFDKNSSINIDNNVSIQENLKDKINNLTFNEIKG